MATWIVAAGMVAGLLGQAEADAPPAADEVIRQAIAELGDERYAVREAASRLLWSQGEAAEPALRKALESDDAEVAYRARRILNDFRFGIFPGLPPETLAAIRRFRRGDQGQRAAALEQLLNQGQMPSLRRLVKLEPMPVVRRQFLSRLLRTVPAEVPPDQADRLGLFLELLELEPDKTVRAQLFGELLSRQPTVDALAKEGRLVAVWKLARDSFDERTRLAITTRLLQSRAAVEALVGDGGADRLMALVDGETDPARRGGLLAGLITSSALQAHLGPEKSVDLAIELARRQKDPVARGRYLKNLLSSSLGHTMLNNADARNRVWSLVRAAADEKPAAEPDWRLEVMLHFFSSATAENLLPKPEDSQLLMRLVRDAPSGDTKTRLVERMAGNSRTVNVLVRHGQLESLLGLIGQMPAPGRGSLRGRLAARIEVSQALAASGRIGLLVSLAEKETDANARSAYLGSGLLRNSHAMSELIKAGRYDALCRVIDAEENPVRRATIRGEFVQSAPIVKLIDERGQLESLLDFARNESDSEARGEYLKRLFSSEAALALLIERGHMEALIALARDEDKVRQAELQRRLFTNNSMQNRLIETGRAALLLEPAAGITDEQQRFVYVSRLASRPQVVAALADVGRFEEIVALIGEKENTSRAMVLRNVFSSPWVVEHFAKRDALDELFRLLDAQWGAARLPILENLLASTSLSRILDGDGLDEYLDAIKRQPAAEWRGRILGRVLANSQVIKHLKTKGRSDVPEQIAKDLDDEEARHAFLESLFSSSSALGAWIESGSFEALYALTSGIEDGRARAGLLVLLLTNRKAPPQVDGKDRFRVVLDLATGEEDEEVRPIFAEALFSNRTAIEQLLERGHFEDLFALAAGEDNPAKRDQLLGRLLGNPAAIRLLADEDRLGMVVERAAREQSVETRRILLDALVRRPEAVPSLAKSGRLDELVRLCRSFRDESPRRSLLCMLINKPEGLAHLAQAGSLRETVLDVLGGPDGGRMYVESWLQSADTLDALVEQGLIEALQKAVNRDDDPGRRARNRLSLLTAPKVVRKLAAEGKLDEVSQAIAEVSSGAGNPSGDPFASNSRSAMAMILSRPETLKTLLENGMESSLLGLIESQPAGRARRDATERFLFSPATIEHLAARSWLDRYRKLLADEPGVQSRSAAISRLVSNGEVLKRLCEAKLSGELIALVKAQPEADRQRIATNLFVNRQCQKILVEGGQGDLLLQLKDWLPDDGFRQYHLSRLIYGPAGVVAHYLNRDDYAKAESLLEENAQDDQGRLQLAAFLLVSGRLDERIAAERERVDRQAGDDRLLVYLLRAGGDLEGACQAAERTGDAGLRPAMLAEAGRWSEAATLQAAEQCPLPIPMVHGTANDDLGPRAEQLSLVAAYHRLAGQAAESDKALAELGELADSRPDDQKLRWCSVEALLLNDRVQEGLKRLAALYPHRAFDLYAVRHEYDKAFALAGFDAAAPPGGDWPGSLFAGSGTGAEQARARIELALKVAGTLRGLGKTVESEKVLELAERYAAGQPGDSTRPFQSSAAQCFQALALRLMAMGEEERAWKWLARAHGAYSTSHPPPLYSQLYGDRCDEAQGWWYIFRGQYATEPLEAIYPRVHRALNPPPDETAEAFAELVEQMSGLVESFTDYNREMVLNAVGEACLARGRLELARRFLKPYRDTSSTAAYLWGEVLRREEKWGEAAVAYQSAWELDHERPLALYLAGDALRRAGREEEGARQKHRADLVALESRARTEVALGLLRHGLTEEAAAEFELVLKTSPPGHWQWHEAARRLGDRLGSEQPAAAADWQEQAILDDLRTQFYLLDDTSYLKARARIHRLRAAEAIGRGDFDAAERSVEMALAALPGDSDLAETLAALLERAGRTKEANKLVDRLAGHYESRLDTYPRSAGLNNNLAWLLARCGRRLDEALAHAERAVELAPQNAAYLDTAAEASFRRGDREAAIRYAGQARDLRPHDATFRERLAHFQHAKLP